MIEIHTSSIAAAIASDVHALYLFEGCTSQENHRLHLTSENFDEPRGLDIVAWSRLAIGVHEASGDDDFAIVGGRNKRAKALILAALAKFGATDVGQHICWALALAIFTTEPEGRVCSWKFREDCAISWPPRTSD